MHRRGREVGRIHPEGGIPGFFAGPQEDYPTQPAQGHLEARREPGRRRPGLCHVCPAGDSPSHRRGPRDRGASFKEFIKG